LVDYSNTMTTKERYWKVTQEKDVENIREKLIKLKFDG